MPTEKVNKKLYNGEVEIVYYPNSHQYKYNGENLISVTGALGMLAKPMLVPWAVNQTVSFLGQHMGESITQELLDEASVQYEKTRDEAASLGSRVHAWANSYLLGENIPLPEDERVLNGVLAFLRWVEEHKVKFTSTERLVFSKKHGYVGTLDAEAIIDGRHRLVDFKTSKGIYLDHFFQVAAYQKAAIEEGTVYDAPPIIVRFGKEDGIFDVKDSEDVDSDFDSFLALLTVKKREKAYLKNKRA